jgi:MarR family 2-MHQ and catechol resistance regulon transcriptional repressor
MMVTVSNLTGIVDRLEEKKLVLRKRDENDRRVVHVVLTEKGTKLYKTTIPLFEKSLSRIFSSLEKPQQKELSALLRKLNRISWAKKPNPQDSRSGERSRQTQPQTRAR